MGNSRTYPDEDQGKEMRKGYDPSKVDADENAIDMVEEEEDEEEEEEDDDDDDEVQPSTSRFGHSAEEEQNAWRRSP